MKTAHCIHDIYQVYNMCYMLQKFFFFSEALKLSYLHAGQKRYKHKPIGNIKFAF